MNTTRKHLLIINTGGTISMQPSENGYIPATNYIGKCLAAMPELNSLELPSYDLIECDPIIDSANMDQHHWNHIAETIFKNYQQYDGFLILHGTDTMAYTASALSFLFDNLTKPIILTGAQIPPAEVHSDAQDNIINSLLLIQHYAIPEVCLLFNNTLFRGNRSKKMHSNDFNAYLSPNYPPLANIGSEIKLRDDLFLKPNKTDTHLAKLTNPTILYLNLYPGMANYLLEAIMQPPLQAIVLGCYGIGNAPTLDKQFLQVLDKAVQQGIIIVNCTQCLYGSVNMKKYQSGQLLESFGVISGYDMTIEAAVTKLIYLLSQPSDPEQVKVLMQQNLRGELTCTMRNYSGM